MLREIIIPRKRDYLIEIPSEYLNKKVEILVLPIGNEFTMESVSDNADEYRSELVDKIIKRDAKALKELSKL